MLVATACGAVDVVLVMAGRSSWTMANAIVALGVNLALNLLLIPPFGIMGAAVAWAVAILINNLAPLTELALWMRLHPFGRPTVVATVVCAVRHRSRARRSLKVDSAACFAASGPRSFLKPRCTRSRRS